MSEVGLTVFGQLSVFRHQFICLLVISKVICGLIWAYFTMTGDCDTQGDCVSSNNYPQVHGNSESCTITMLQDASVSVGSTFSLETCCDHLMIHGNDVESSDTVPTSLRANDELTWSSDGSVTREGWQLCFSEPSGSNPSSNTSWGFSKVKGQDDSHLWMMIFYKP